MLPTEVSLYSNNRLELYRAKVAETLNKTLKDLRSEQIKSYVDDIVADIKNTKSILSTSTIPFGSKISAEIYNGTMRGLTIDLMTIYNEIDQMVTMFNAMVKAVNQSDKQLTDKINLAFSKLRSLEQIKSSGKNFDLIEYETFVTQSNTQVGRSAAVIPNDAGLLRMANDKVTSVYKEQNDADIVPVILNNNLTTLEYYAGDVSSNDSYNANYMELFTQDNTLVNTVIGGKAINTINYNGAVVAYFIYLPSNRQINNLFFKPYGDAEFDVLGLYTSELNVKNIYDQSFIKVDLNYDTYNYNSYEFNFTPLQARTILLILGQSHYTSVTRKIPKFGFSSKSSLIEGTASANDSRSKLKKLSELLNNLYAYSTAARTDKQVNALLAEYGNGFNFSGLSTKLQRVISSISTLLYEDSDLIDVTGNLFKVGMYGLNIAMNEYMVDSYFVSKPYNVGYNNLLSIQFTPTLSNNTATNIMYDIVINGVDYPILPTNVIKDSDNRIVNTDSIPVVNIFTTIYKTRFLADATKSFNVLINNEIIPASQYTLLYLSNSVIYGIDTSAVINPGDVISMRYTLPEYDHHGIAYEPYNFFIDKIIDPPHIINTSLYYGDSNRILIGSGTSYIPYQKTDVISADYIKDGIVYDCWFVKTIKLDPDTILDPLFPNQVEVNNELGYLFQKNVSTIDSRTNYYAGIYNERVNSSGQTAYPYIPGSITLVLNDSETTVQEYDDTGLSLNTYTLDAKQLAQASGVVSYCPIDIKNAVTNIKDHNQVEYYETTTNATLNLKSAVYVDQGIVADTKTWAFGDGIFVMLDNTKITYEPIRIKIGNRYAVNKTNYLDQQNISALMEPYDTKYNNIQFYHVGNKVFFNTDIINTIEVYYYRSVAEVKCKITMINPSKTNNFVTPEIYEYAIMFDMRDNDV